MLLGGDTLAMDYSQAAVLSMKVDPGADFINPLNIAPLSMDNLHSRDLHVQPRTSHAFWIALLVVVIPTVLGFCGDLFVWPKRYKTAAGVPAWALLLFISSFVLLFPGLQSEVFSARVEIRDPLTRTPMDLMPDREKELPGIMHESMLSMITFLRLCKAPLASVALFVYAVIVPILKLVLFIFSACFREHENTKLARLARINVIVVQLISKWDSPKVMTYVLVRVILVAMMRPPTITSSVYLHSGFVCYTVYCVATLIASLAVTVPPMVGGDKRERPFTLRLIGHDMFPWYALIITLMTLLLFVVGTNLPFLHISLDPLSPQAAFSGADPLVKGVIRSMHIPDWADWNYTIMSYLGVLVHRIFESCSMSAFLSVAFIVYFFVACTLLDIFCLLFAIASFMQWRRDKTLAGGSPKTFANPESIRRALILAKWFKYMSMADAFCIAVLTVKFGCGASFVLAGLLMDVGPAVYVTLIADVFHYIAHFSVYYGIKYELEEEGHRVPE